MEHFQLQLAPQWGRLHDVHPALGPYWSVEDGGLDSLRTRWLRARASRLSEAMGPVDLDDKGALRVLSDDETMPGERQMSLSLSPPFDLANRLYRGELDPLPFDLSLPLSPFHVFTAESWLHGRICASCTAADAPRS